MSDRGTGASIIIGQQVEPIGEDSTFNGEIPLSCPLQAVRAQSFGQYPSEGPRGSHDRGCTVVGWGLGYPFEGELITSSLFIQ